MELQPAIDKILSSLKNPEVGFWKSLTNEIDQALRAHQAAGDETSANEAWFLRTVCESRRLFLGAVANVQSGEYYKAWCNFETAELASLQLLENPFLDVNQYEVRELFVLISSWQETYPYQVFLSPEFRHKHLECSICNSKVSPWDDCGHSPGTVYCGRYCHHIVRDVEILSISMVKDPVQKYSVIHTTKDADGNEMEIFEYKTVRFVAERITHPFHQFRVVWTRAPHPHELFSDQPESGPCPCKSGRPYRDCCLTGSGVMRPHMQITFLGEVAQPLPELVFLGYAKNAPPGEES
tara:strand:- start:171 stop:1055 length:885 start_codon:yes stop_codon:yes gene_type:complete